MPSGWYVLSLVCSYTIVFIGIGYDNIFFAGVGSFIAGICMRALYEDDIWD